MELSKEIMVDLLQVMFRIRFFEAAVNEHFQKNDIPGFAHLYIGEEATAAGVCATLNVDDYITSTHRGHGHCIAKGAKLKLLMAELWGRETGYCKGRGGSMHIFVKELGILGTNGIVGAGLPLALGAAMHAKLGKEKKVCVCFFGDGAANNGTFHESLNLAAIQNLPVIFICENNLYATVTPVNRATKTKNFADRAASYGLPGVIVDGNDVIEVFKNAKKAVDKARNGDGPSLLECKTYRYYGHYVGEPGIGYRTKEEIEKWKERDPIKLFSKYLKDNRVLGVEQIEKIRQETEREAVEAVEFARNSPWPDPINFANIYGGEK